MHKKTNANINRVEHSYLIRGCRFGLRAAKVKDPHDVDQANDAPSS